MRLPTSWILTANEIDKFKLCIVQCIAITFSDSFKINLGSSFPRTSYLVQCHSTNPYISLDLFLSRCKIFSAICSCESRSRYINFTKFSCMLFSLYILRKQIARNSSHRISSSEEILWTLAVFMSWMISWRMVFLPITSSIILF